MARFMCTHTLPPGGLTLDDVRGFAKAAQSDPIVRGYRSFASLSEGKAVCILEAPDAKSVEGWFTTMGMPYDSITRLELEGELGEIRTEPGITETLRRTKPGLAA